MMDFDNENNQQHSGSDNFSQEKEDGLFKKESQKEIKKEEIVENKQKIAISQEVNEDMVKEDEDQLPQQSEEEEDDIF